MHTKEGLMRLKNGYTEVTSEIIGAIKAEIDRTGIGPGRALKGNKEARSLCLSSGTIYRIIGINGQAKSVRNDHIELTLSLWKDIPNKEDRPVSKPISGEEKGKRIFRAALLTNQSRRSS